MRRIKQYFAVLALFLCACTATQTTPLPTSPKASLERPIYTPVTPVEAPTAFTHTVKQQEIDGVRYILIREEDSKKVMQAYVSAESNTDLVRKLDELNRLRVEQLNTTIDILELEELRNEKLKTYINEDQRLREEMQRNTVYEMWLWRAMTAVGLAVGIW